MYKFSSNNIEVVMFSTERIVEFGMCDIGGILFFAKIFDLSHSAYEEFVLRSDLEESYFENKLFAIPLINASADFQKPISLHEVLKINISVANIGSSSFQLLTNFLSESGEQKASVKTTHIFVNKLDFKKRDIPKEFLDLLAQHKI